MLSILTFLKAHKSGGAPNKPENSFWFASSTNPVILSFHISKNKLSCLIYVTHSIGKILAAMHSPLPLFISFLSAFFLEYILQSPLVMFKIVFPFSLSLGRQEGKKNKVVLHLQNRSNTREEDFPPVSYLIEKRGHSRDIL